MFKMSLLIISVILFGCGENFEDGQTDAGTNNDTDTTTNLEGVICDDPPDAKCTEDGDLVFYTGEAMHIYDECYYSHKVIICENGCDDSNGNYECIDPCNEVVCDDPPDGWCEVNDSEHDETWNYKSSGYCQSNEDSSPQCIYTIRPEMDCTQTSFGPNCEVIDGIAECVED